MSSWKAEIGGCFAYDAAPFAVHGLDEKRAFDLLKRMRDEGIGWKSAKTEIEKYLQGKSSDANWINNQLARAEEHYKPWLLD